MAVALADEGRTEFADTEPASPAFAATRVIGKPAKRRPFSHNALPDGAGIEGFRIVRTVGEGGFGIVYLAWDASLERHVAIKEYMPASLAVRGDGLFQVALRHDGDREIFEAGLRSFVNEARLLARFDHPALVKVFRFWEANGTAYMAMPFYEGPTLRTALATLGAPPTEAQLRAWLDPLLDALSVLHGARCYHRDIAPDNILLTPAGPLLLDFGAARRVINDRAQELTAILKPDFAPIEQYGGVMLQGPWTDLYALAGVVHYAITGRPPVASAARVAGDPLEALALRCKGRFSASFLAAIDAALAIRPEDRPQDVAQFREWLDRGVPERVAPREQVAARVEAPAEPLAGAQPRSTALADAQADARPHSRREAPSARTRHGLWIGLLGLGLVALLAVAMSWLSRSPESRGEAAKSTAPSPTPAEIAPSAAVPQAAPAAGAIPSDPAAAPGATVAPSASNPAPTELSTPAAPIAGRTEPDPGVRPGAAQARRSTAATGTSSNRSARAPEPAPAAAATTTARNAGARPPRCEEIVQKSSLEPLRPDEVAYLKRECR